VRQKHKKDWWEYPNDEKKITREKWVK